MFFLSFFFSHQRLGSAPSFHHKCNKYALDGSQCSHSSKCDSLGCKECQEQDRFHVPEASVRFHPEECLASSRLQGLEGPTSVWEEAWAKHSRYVVLACRVRARDLPTSSSRMFVTSQHRDTQQEWPCNHMIRFNSPSLSQWVSCLKVFSLSSLQLGVIIF